MKETIRIGCGAGFSGDRFEPAVILAEKGQLDYLVLECLAERTIALAQQQKQINPDLGYDPFLERRISSLLPFLEKKKIRLITNMGAANPIAAARKVKELCLEQGLDLKVAAVTGDDVLGLITGNEMAIETNKPISESGSLVSANAYLGIEGIIESLAADSDIIITGRVADPSLFLAPMVFEFGWTDAEQFGQGTVIGHLLECGGQLTGGYFMDVSRKKIADPANLGFPIAEVSRNGAAILSKVDGTGGNLNLRTVKEQLLYEVLNPYKYITPDVIADFSKVRLTELRKDEVLVEGGIGAEASNYLKVSVGYKAYHLGEGEISYTGYDAVDRSKLAITILEERLKSDGVQEVRYDLIGLNSINEDKFSVNSFPYDVRLRVAAKCSSKIEAQRIGEEVEALYTNGPAGGGGSRKYYKEVIGIHSIFVRKEDVSFKVTIL
ncbi:protein of unknown function DUF1446 [Leadbetterella byssophila DSM 17132]|uniref:Acyclic terpene utilisation N-terminal domain-containing protein n=1 Tax=Leadbetterella byssophila (strain DSM 17132 / JCM 16389 / KACC 11308 / NBRC 106382 / 4M15) TaxID=649349 RepID=E4RUR3_LEAB4|nr:acyclic terpene utilization AtuA family protein [Leadbetterella byssophila]ADQ16064.1 protein of unknown function DUF1446 [Leadbetterella byssophila DSM 17132]